MYLIQITFYMELILGLKNGVFAIPCVHMNILNGRYKSQIKIESYYT
jgi:hypothetical protein